GSGWKNSFWLKPCVRMLTPPGSTFESTLWTSPVTSLLLLAPKLVTERVVVFRPKAATSPPATSAPTRAPMRAGHSHERDGVVVATGGAAGIPGCSAVGSFAVSLRVGMVSFSGGSQVGRSSSTGARLSSGHGPCSCPRLHHPKGSQPSY